MATLAIDSSLKLNDGHSIPVLGLGVAASATTTKACLASFEEGYRQIDTAQLYGNEAEVGVSLHPEAQSPACDKLMPDAYCRKPSKPPPSHAPLSTSSQKYGILSTQKLQPTKPFVTPLIPSSSTTSTSISSTIPARDPQADIKHGLAYNKQLKRAK